MDKVRKVHYSNNVQKIRTSQLWRIRNWSLDRKPSLSRAMILEVGLKSLIQSRPNSSYSHMMWCRCLVILYPPKTIRGWISLFPRMEYTGHWRRLVKNRGGWGKTPMRGKMPMDNISQVSNAWSLLCVTLASASFVNTNYSLKVDFVSIYKLQRKF